MLTRRENLLVRPWQQRRFQSHRRKVRSALPAIDANAPAERAHVAHKLKKLQREEERVCRIENDNVRLLQRMAAIMRTSRLDNRWITEPPGSFLGRIGIYAPPSSLTSRRESVTSEPAPSPATVPSGGGRKVTCTACALKKKQQELQRKESEDKMKVSSEDKFPSVMEPCSKLNTPSTKKKKKKNKLRQTAIKFQPPLREWTPPQARLEWSSASNRVVLTRGQLQVSVSYPSHTGVVVERAGCAPQVLDTEFCSCAAKLPPSSA